MVSPTLLIDIILRNERIIYRLIVDLFECVHDVRVVQSPEAAKHGMVQQALVAIGHPVQLGHRPYRVLLHGAGQPDRLPRQRRPVQPLAAQGDPGVPVADGLHPFHAAVLQGPAFHPQPSHRLRPAGPGGLLHLQKIMDEG